MTSPAAHAAFLEEAQKDLEEAKAKVRELEIVVAWHAEHARGANGKPKPPVTLPPGLRHPSQSRQGRFDGMTKHEAARAALLEMNRPAKIGAIIDVLQAAGYDADMERKVLHNSLFTAMSRKPETFAKNDDAEWLLAEGDPENE